MHPATLHKYTSFILRNKIVICQSQKHGQKLAVFLEKLVTLQPKFKKEE